MIPTFQSVWFKTHPLLLISSFWLPTLDHNWITTTYD